MSHAHAIAEVSHGNGLADILERVLQTGVVIAGDIRVKLCDVELLTIQLRLVVCSVEKARELGITWWWQEPGATAAGQRAEPARLASRAGAAPSAPPPDAGVTWEEFQRFCEFERFREAMRVDGASGSMAPHGSRETTGEALE
jgi:hypothetical protein